VKLLDKKTTLDLTKLVIFMVVTTIATGVLVATIGNLTFAGAATYKAVFADATSVNKGDDIRVAGVKVGTVKEVAITDRTRALITFSVDDSTSVTEATHATIKYRNLVGQRYIALTQEVGSSSKLAEGATIPIARTAPALDLTVLFNGFKPLFAALSPKDVNELSGNIISVLQGEGGNINSLLAKTASLTSTLADRDEVIGRTISNLNTVLGTVDERDAALKELIDQLARFVSGLAADRKTIGASLSNINSLTAQTADLLKVTRAPLKSDIANLRALATNLNEPANTATFEKFLSTSPGKIATITRTATYGSWFNFYLCDFSGTIKLPAGPAIKLDKPEQLSAARCS
jgi:phospholipid/cholesterol/gamma-HCH transport system substrate-binding protein